jgi:hypothetical protein
MHETARRHCELLQFADIRFSCSRQLTALTLQYREHEYYILKVAAPAPALVLSACTSPSINFFYPFIRPWYRRRYARFMDHATQGPFFSVRRQRIRPIPGGRGTTAPYHPFPEECPNIL